MRRALLYAMLGAAVSDASHDVAVAQPVIRHRQTAERKEAYDTRSQKLRELSPGERDTKVWLPYRDNPAADPLKDDPAVIYRQDGQGRRYRYFDWSSPAPASTPAPGTPAPKSSPFDSPFDLNRGPSSGQPGPQSNAPTGTAPRAHFGYDESLAKEPAAPKGVTMRVGIGRGTLQRVEAAPSLLEAIRSAK